MNKCFILFPSRLQYFGHRFLVGPHIYHSGGAGYVMSRASLKNLIAKYPTECKLASGVEDIQMGKCMRDVGAEVGEARWVVSLICYAVGKGILRWLQQGHGLIGAEHDCLLGNSDGKGRRGHANGEPHAGCSGKVGRGRLRVRIKILFNEVGHN